MLDKQNINGQTEVGHNLHEKNGLQKNKTKKPQHHHDGVGLFFSDPLSLETWVKSTNR